MLEAQNRVFKSALDLIVEQLKSRTLVAEGTIKDLIVTQGELIKALEFTHSESKELTN